MFQKSFYRRISNLLLGLIVICLFWGTARAAEPEIRGTWVTTTGNDAISNPDRTAETMKRLREIGLNTVYLECWKNGFTEYPSQTMQKLIGIPMKVNAAPPALQRDLLLETSIEAHRHGLLAIAWFEYGFMVSYKATNNPLRALGEKEGWLLRDPNGNVVSKQDNFVWMNPLHPKAQQILLDLVLDAVRNYDLDGIQLDDRISMPTEMGYDSYTKDLYAKEHDGRQPPVDAKNPEWIKWRADKITAFARKFAAAVHSVNPRLIISASPAPYPWCYENFACDWPTWMKWTGDQAWDECIPQNYRLDFAKTKSSIEEGFAVIGDRKSDLAAGIRIVGDGPDMSAGDVVQTIQFTRQQRLGGHVLWFSRGVLDTYPQQLTDFYNVAKLGQAPHPKRPADWRSEPVVATQTSTGNWAFNLSKPDKYQIISYQNGKWVLKESRSLPAGQGNFASAGSDRVELLPDRRP